MATDKAGNTAICEFDVVVSPEECGQPIYTDSIVVNSTRLDAIDYLRDQVKVMSVIWCSNEEFVFTQ